ncbi:MAG TPA: thiamine pyrophosphate-dependent enzyme [Gemmatimonadaceae bacterium]|nr:thiamine pyrophosphate-dependent enzyme [Gemmatimonadaceae bacterium]
MSVQLPPFIERRPDGRPDIGLSADAVYRYGYLIRQSESLLLDLFTQGLLSGTTHTCIGQELCQMSVVRALTQPEDAVVSNHRNHGHFLTYSGDFLGLIAEIMGREAGVCGGIGGSQHLAYHHFHSNGVQAGMTAIAVGQALARQRSGSKAVVAAIIGDGTLGEGLLYESMNLASIWRLPLLFVVEHNGIAQTTPTTDTIGGGSIEARGRAFGLSTWRLDDADPGFLEAVEGVVEAVREDGPGFLVIDTQRLGPHSKGDDLRDAQTMARIRDRDPLMRMGDRLPPDVRSQIEEEARAFIADIRRRAESSPDAATLIAHRSIVRPARRAPAGEGVTPAAGNVRSRINAALDHLLASDPTVVLIGEDLHEPYGGAFKVTQGLSARYPARVLSSPISEAGIVGTGIGLAMSGWKPVVEIMFADFVTLAMDQLYNHAVKFPGMFADVEVPLVVRTPSGGRRGYGPTHSQSPEHLMAAIPGLTVVYPSHRHDVAGLLVNAVQRWPNPTLFFEHKLLYGEPCDPAGYDRLPGGAGESATDLFPTLVRRDEREPDVTIVTYGGMLPVVERFAEEMRHEELSVELVVPSLLAPFAGDDLVAYLMRRERVAVFEEGYGESGFGVSLGAALAEAGYRGRFRRVNPPPVPIPAARSLEPLVLPERRQMLDAVVALLTHS